MSEGASARAGRLRTILVLEIVRIVEDLSARREFMVGVWSRTRRREVLIDTVHSRWRSVGVAELLELTEDQMVALDTFHRELEELRVYLSHTDDMPMSLGDQLELALSRLLPLGDAALAALGAPPMREVELNSASYGWRSLEDVEELGHGAETVDEPPGS